MVARASSWFAGNCTYQAVDTINQQVVHPILTNLVQTAFFRFFKASWSWALNAGGGGVWDS